MTSNRKRISGLLGGAIGLVGLGFVVRLVLRERETIADLVADGNPVWFLVAVAAGLAGMTGIGLTWGVIVRDLDQSLSLPQTLRAYFVGQLGKYVPGGVWAVMGRGEWASRAGVPRAAGYTSTVLSIVTTYLAASALAGVAIVIGARPDSWLLPGATALLAPVGIVCLHPAILRVGLRTMGRLRSSLNDLQPMPWLSSFGYVLRQLPSWVLITVATGAVAQGLGVDIDVRSLMLATAVSWVAGFLFLPTPGGIGIREAAFVAVLHGDGTVAAVSLGARLVFVLVDGIGAITSSAMVRAEQREVV